MNDKHYTWAKAVGVRFIRSALGTFLAGAAVVAGANVLAGVSDPDQIPVLAQAILAFDWKSLLTLSVVSGVGSFLLAIFTSLPEVDTGTQPSKAISKALVKDVSDQEEDI